MNTSHVMTTGGTTALVAQALIYLTHWPLAPMDENTAMAVAGLLVIGGAGLISLLPSVKAASRAALLVAAIGLVPMLSACGAGGIAAPGGASSSGTAASGPDPLAQIATFAIADLMAADAEAVAQGDAIAHNPKEPCYPALAAWVAGLQGQASGVTANINVKGAFSAFQAARGVRLKVESSAGNFSLKSIVPVDVRNACSALFLDEQTFLLKVAALAGAAAATGGAAPALLPALGGMLPIKLP